MLLSEDLKALPIAQSSENLELLTKMSGGILAERLAPHYRNILFCLKNCSAKYYHPCRTGGLLHPVSFSLLGGLRKLAVGLNPESQPSGILFF